MADLRRLGDVTVVTGPEWPGVTYFTTTRQGGVSQGPWASLNVGLHTGDDPAHVAENRKRLMPPGRQLFWLRQVHGTDVYDVDTHAGTDNGLAPDGAADDYVVTGIDDSGISGGDDVCADALVTSCPDSVLAIMTADCLPVVMGSADGRVIGIAHAGWRGLAAGVLENTLAVLKKKYIGQMPPRWRAWVGPGISQPYFEVGNDVRVAFLDVDPLFSMFFVPSHQPGKWLADLPGLALRRLQNWGVGQITVSTLCTYRDVDLFYSYRRDGVTGRLVTIARCNGGRVTKGNGVS